MPIGQVDWFAAQTVLLSLFVLKDYETEIRNSFLAIRKVFGLGHTLVVNAYVHNLWKKKRN